MNSDTYEQLTTIAKDAGAILTCEECWSHDLGSADGDAKNRALAMASEASKHGRFGTIDREEIVEAMDDLLRGADQICPRCG
jgi:hypothetical protein